MRNEITAGRQFYIIPDDLDSAGECIVIETPDDCFKVKLKNKHKITAGETAALFSVSACGRIYFEAVVKETGEKIISLWYPVIIKHLQRREYERIPVEGSSVLLKDGTRTLRAKISNISPGGFQIITESALELLKIYSAVISIDNKTVKTDFQPVRLEASSGGFIAAGKFTNISGYDKIFLAQYCCSRRIELRAY